MSGEDWGSAQYVRERFRRYYAINSGSVKAPPDILRREFGFLSFEGRSMYRHIAFRDVTELRQYLRDYAPSHAYFSAAYYEKPDYEMENKGWQGADLIFDIDADHFDLACQEEHDRWSCSTCGREGRGHPPEACPGCGKATFQEENWLCPDCLHAAKYEAQKLLDILVQDFGFSPTGEISVNFSGNRGYHVHVRSKMVKAMDQLARREIVDYILGIGLKVEHQGFTSRPSGGNSNLAERGWRGRSTKALYDFISEASPEAIKDLKLSRPSTKNLLESRAEILDLLAKSHPSSIMKYLDQKSLGRMMDAAVGEQASAIDTVVTTDLRRLIRLPLTLHGKTGWLTQKVPIEELADYDPLLSAIAFTEGTERVYIRRAPEITIAGERYGPFEEEAAELPTAVAMFLLCRKAARVER